MADEKFTRTLNLPGGGTQTYEADTEQALLDKVFEAHQAGVTALKDREHQIYTHKENETRLQTELDSRPAPVVPAVPSSTDAYSDQTYYQIWADPNQGPRVANEYLLKFDTAHQKLLKRVEQSDQMVGMIQESSAVQNFHAMHPDYPATPEAANVLRTRFEQLQAKGFPTDAGTYDLAFTQLVREKAITPQAVKPVGEGDPANRGAGAPPAGGGEGGGPPAGDDLPDFDAMSTEEHQKWLVDNGYKDGAS